MVATCSGGSMIFGKGGASLDRGGGASLDRGGARSDSTAVCGRK